MTDTSYDCDVFVLKSLILEIPTVPKHQTLQSNALHGL